MAKNQNLHAAKTAKNDEFYTRYEDINQELGQHEHGYIPQFKDKVVYCNCDDPEWSNFWKYFKDAFKYYGLKELISTHYDESGKSSYVLRYNGERVTKTELEGTGDFRSKECIEFLKEADVVVTNPPFSLFREYVAQLVKYEKKFAVIGNMNAITYKEIFPLIKTGEIKMGYNFNKTMSFAVPENYRFDEKETAAINDGKRYGKVPAIAWFTNFDLPKHHLPLETAWEYYNEINAGKYPKYDNYDAINIDKVSEIPCDYFGVMGVPITFLDKYCPEQFEIVAFRKGEDGQDLVFTTEREREFNRTFESLFDGEIWVDYRGKKYDVRGWQKQIRESRNQTEMTPVDYFHPLATNLKNGMINDQTINGKKGYCRILIRRKE